MIKVGCKSCRKTIGVPVKHAGKLIKCPNCSEPVRVPKASTVQEPATPKIARSPLDDPYRDNGNTGNRDEQGSDSDVDLLGGPMVDPLSSQADNQWSHAQPTAPLANSLSSKPRNPYNKPAVDSRAKTSKSNSGNGNTAAVPIGRSFAGLTVAAIVAGICAFAWVLLAFVTGYELGILAWGTGGLIGLVAGAIAKNPSPIYCGLTAIVAAISFFSAKIVMALVVMAAFFGLDMAQNFQIMDGTTRKYHASAMLEMIENGDFDEQETPVANDIVEGFFNGESDGALEEFLINTGNPEDASLHSGINEKVRTKLKPLTQEQKLTMLEKARQANPQWMEYENQFIPLLDLMLEGNEIDDKALAEQAKSKISNVTLDDVESEDGLKDESEEDYDYDVFVERENELRKLARIKLATIPLDQRDQIVRDFLANHLNWSPYYDSFCAMAKKMQAEGRFKGELKSYADAELNDIFGEDESTFFDDLSDEKYTRFDKQYRELVNGQLVGLEASQREQLVASTKEANPDWYTVGEFDSVPNGMDGLDFGGEIDEIKADLGGDGTFVGSYRSVSGWLDILWILLSTTTAYSVASKQGADS